MQRKERTLRAIICPTLLICACCFLASCTSSNQNSTNEAKDEVDAFSPCENTKYSPSEIFKNSINSIAVITSGDSQGSGFIVRQDDRYTYVLTNSHVVAGNDLVKVKWSDNREDKGKVIADYGADELHRDTALVQIDALRGKPLKLQQTTPEIGSDVVVIGAPQGLEFSLTRGVLSQIRKQGDFLQVDAPVNPGNSGGPLFDQTGCVAGLITFKTEESEGLNFAIGYKPIQKFLDNPAIERQETKPAIAVKSDPLINLYEPPILDLSTASAPLGPVPKPPGSGWTISEIKCWNKICGPSYDRQHRWFENPINEKHFISKYLLGKNTIIHFKWVKFGGRVGEKGHYSSGRSDLLVDKDKIDRVVGEEIYFHIVDCDFSDPMGRSVLVEEYSSKSPGKLIITNTRNIINPQNSYDRHARDACLTGTVIESTQLP